MPGASESPQVIPSRRGKPEFTRKGSDFATLREVAAIVNEGNRRQKEYFDECFSAFVQEYEAREAAKSPIRTKIKSVISRFRKKAT